MGAATKCAWLGIRNTRLTGWVERDDAEQTVSKFKRRLQGFTALHPTHEPLKLNV